MKTIIKFLKEIIKSIGLFIEIKFHPQWKINKRLIDNDWDKELNKFLDCDPKFETSDRNRTLNNLNLSIDVSEYPEYYGVIRKNGQWLIPKPKTRIRLRKIHIKTIQREQKRLQELNNAERF